MICRRAPTNRSICRDRCICRKSEIWNLIVEINIEVSHGQNNNRSGNPDHRYAAGAALMYLLDPEKGRQRREKITHLAGDALESAGNYAGNTWQSVSEKVSDIAGDLQDRAGDFASEHDSSYIKDQLGKLAGYATVLGSKLTNRASNLRDCAADTANDVADHGASYFKRERHGYGTAAAIGAGGIGMLAIGAGLVYFLDPDHGQERRVGAINCANRFVGEVGEFAGKCGTYLRDKFSGVTSGARDLAENVSDHAGDVMQSVASRFSDAATIGATLIDQVRSQLSDRFPSARDLRINHSNGKLTLTGSVPASDYDRILETVRAIPGVTDFDNQLQTAST